MSPNSRSAVDQLLAQYQAYKALLSSQKYVQQQLAKARLLGKDISNLHDEYDLLSDKLSRLSDEMTFESPLVWVAYKYEAYQDESQPITTMSALRVHCSKPGYICTKRYEFLNQWLERLSLEKLSGREVYPDEASIPCIYDILLQLEAHEAFMAEWRSYEYYQENEQVAKWENWKA